MPDLEEVNAIAARVERLALFKLDWWYRSDKNIDPAEFAEIADAFIIVQHLRARASIITGETP